jgi:hypothetical protein
MFGATNPVCRRLDIMLWDFFDQFRALFYQVQVAFLGSFVGQHSVEPTDGKEVAFGLKGVLVHGFDFAHSAGQVFRGIFSLTKYSFTEVHPNFGLYKIKRLKSPTHQPVISRPRSSCRIAALPVVF